MKRFVLLLGLWLGMLSPAASQMMATGIGGGGFGGAGAPAYTGIGDIKSFYAAWGTRAYSSATRGNKLVNVCNSTGGVDVGCADMLSDASTGAIVPQTINGLSCPAANCTIKIWYDLTGNTNCSANACDQVQATVANRVTLTASAIGTKTCGVSSNASQLYATANSLTSQAQPVSATLVAKWASTSGNQLAFGALSGGPGAGYGMATPNFALYGSTIVNGSAADTSPHAIQYIFNTASSFVVVDSTTGSTSTSGGVALSGATALFADAFGQSMASGGIICETGIAVGAWNGTDTSNMHTNQSTYYGTP